MTDGLGSRASRGASTTLLWQGVRILTQLGGLVVLTRLLGANDFGLIVMVTAVVGVGEIIRDFGLTSAAVQARTLSQHQKSNLFWINTALGSMLTLAVYFGAPLIATLYGEPELESLTQALSVTFLLNGVQTQFRAELNRRMRFTALNVTDTLPAILGLASAVLAAYATASVWSLVAQQLVTAASGLLLALLFAKWWPRMPSRQGDIRPLLRFGGGVLGTQAVAYATKNVDSIGIGLIWGTVALGLYSRAYQLLMAPIVQLLAPMTRVALPVLSRLQDQPIRFIAFLRRGQLISSLVAGAVYAVVIGLADPIVRVVFDDEWVGLVPIVQALSVGGIFRALNQVAYWAYLALGRSGAQFRYYLVSQPIIIVMMLAGLPWGPVGVAVAHSIAYGLNWFAALWWCGRVTGLDFGPLIRDGLRTAVSTSLPIAIIGLLASAWVPTPFAAIGVGLAGAGLWLGIAYLVLPGTRHDIVNVLDLLKRSRRGRNQGGKTE